MHADDNLAWMSSLRIISQHIFEPLQLIITFLEHALILLIEKHRIQSDKGQICIRKIISVVAALIESRIGIVKIEIQGSVAWWEPNVK